MAAGSQPAATLPSQRERPNPPPGPFVVAGGGRAGTAAANALAPLGEVTVWDAADPQFDPAAMFTGDCPTVVKSPGIGPEDRLMQAAARSGAYVIDELELGWRMCEAPIVAVTGTNGKSTTCQLICAAASAAGLRMELAGNSDVGVPLSSLAGRTDIDLVVCEVSSFQLEYCDHFLPEVGVLLNVTRDHLHRHGTLERYAQVKASMLMRQANTAPRVVVGSDDGFAAELGRRCTGAGSEVSTFGRSEGADFRVLQTDWELHSSTTQIHIDDQTHAVKSRLIGECNSENIAAALAACSLFGIEQQSAIEAFASCDPVPGRFEAIDRGQPFNVIVDYAHNPAGFAKSLEAIRGATPSPGRVIAVISAAGTHDPGKREAMGRIAAELADLTIVTTGSPRGDDPLRAPNEVFAAAQEVAGSDSRLVLDRRHAIAAGFDEAQPGDTVAVIGRGALSALLGGVAGDEPFDDRVVCAELLAEGRHSRN